MYHQQHGSNGNSCSNGSLISSVSSGAKSVAWRHGINIVTILSMWHVMAISMASVLLRNQQRNQWHRNGNIVKAIISENGESVVIADISNGQY